MGVKCIKCAPLEIAQVVELDTDLESLQEAVGGYIEFVYPPELCEVDECLMIMCNEEGKLDGLPLSRPLYSEDGELYDVIAGTCYIMYDKLEGDGITDIPDDIIEKVMRMPEWLFYGTVVNIGGMIHWLCGGDIENA